MTTEQYQIGYEDGYSAGFEAGTEPAPAVSLSDAEIVKCWEDSTGQKMPNMGSSVRQLLAVARAIERHHGIGIGEKT